MVVLLLRSPGAFTTSSAVLSRRHDGMPQTMRGRSSQTARSFAISIGRADFSWPIGYPRSGEGSWTDYEDCRCPSKSMCGHRDRTFTRVSRSSRRTRSGSLDCLTHDEPHRAGWRRAVRPRVRSRAQANEARVVPAPAFGHLEELPTAARSWSRPYRPISTSSPGASRRRGFFSPPNTTTSAACRSSAPRISNARRRRIDEALVILGTKRPSWCPESLYTAMNADPERSSYVPEMMAENLLSGAIEKHLMLEHLP